MLALLQHRGPDGEGLFLDHGFGFGMRRLAILDREEGHQPYVSEDGRVVAVYNGELYNYAMLKTYVEGRGHRLRSRADGEVLVHLYEELGADMLPRLRGMFAIALWDRRRQELLLARDPVGQKPLYVWHSPHQVAFASELKAFWGLRHFTAALDLRWLSTYLAHRFVPAPHTLLRKVVKLRPGEAVRLSADGRQVAWLYWQPQLTTPTAEGTLDQWSQKLDEALRATVPSHLASDVPIGLFLSGGLDSSLLAALARVAGHDVRDAWSIAWGDHLPAYDETVWAEKVARHFDYAWHPVTAGTITPERLRQIAYALDEPMGDPTVLPLDVVAEAASRENTVIISGEGADEIFAGYAGYGEVATLGHLSRIPRALRQWWTQLGLKGSGAIARTLVPIADRYRGVGFTFDETAQATLLVPELRMSDRPPAVHDYWAAVRELPALQAMQGFDVRWFLPDDVLVKADRIGMRHHLEIRVPYCDPEVIELALAVPLHWRRSRGIDKRVLRQAAQRYLPPAIVRRSKRGFPTPLTYWMSGLFYDFAYDTLTSRTFRQRGWFMPEAIDHLLAGLTRQSSTVARQVYALLMLELWAEELVDQNHARVNRANDETWARQSAPQLLGPSV